MTSQQELQGAFHTERLVFRAVEDNEEDKKFIGRIEQDPVGTALGNPRILHPKPTLASAGMVGSMLKSLLNVIICLQPQDDGSQEQKPTPIGYMVLGWGGQEAAMAHHRKAMVSIAIDVPFQNRGYGGEAINWCLDWGFRVANLHRVEIGAVAYNERAVHLYKKLGFKEEGRSREAHYYNLKYYDVVSMGMLFDEWKALRGLE